MTVKVKVNPSLISHRQTVMTTYSEAVCHAGQHKETVLYNVYIAPCQDTHKALRHGSHSSTCKLRHACLLFRKHSPDGATLKWKASDWSLLLIYRPRRDDRLNWSGWLTYSGWFARISGYPSATGRAQDRKVRRPKTDIIPLSHATNR